MVAPTCKKRAKPAAIKPRNEATAACQSQIVATSGRICDGTRRIAQTIVHAVLAAFRQFPSLRRRTFRAGFTDILRRGLARTPIRASTIAGTLLLPRHETSSVAMAWGAPALRTCGRTTTFFYGTSLLATPKLQETTRTSSKGASAALPSLLGTSPCAAMKFSS